MNYRVRHQKVSIPPFPPSSEEIIHGPYRWLWQAKVIAWLVCGSWDRCIVEERRK